MKVDDKKILIGVGVLVIGYLAYKKFKGTSNPIAVTNAITVPNAIISEEQKKLNKEKEEEDQEAINDANEVKRIAIEEAKQAIIDAEDRASILAGRG